MIEKKEHPHLKIEVKTYTPSQVEKNIKRLDEILFDVPGVKPGHLSDNLEDKFVFVAETDNNRIAGVALAIEKYNRLFVKAIAVDKKYRKSNPAQELKRYIFEKAKKDYSGIIIADFANERLQKALSSRFETREIGIPSPLEDDSYTEINLNEEKHKPQ